MIKYQGSITDVPFVTVGQTQNTEAGTGVTVVLAGEEGAVCGCDVRGSAPGTRETALMGQGKLVQKCHGVALCGGSAYGLAAADGVMRFLEEKGIGMDTGFAKVPIVPAAVIFDLGYKNPSVRPSEQMGYTACTLAKKETEQGSVGAGCGATTGKLLGADFCCKTGVGTASIKLKSGAVVGAIAVVNPLGDVLEENGEIIAGVQKDGVFLGSKKLMLEGGLPSSMCNTTIGVVATNAAVTKDQAAKLAQAAQSGLAKAIDPAHTMLDGDTVFALAAGDIKEDINILAAAAQEAMRRAIINGATAK